MRQAVLGRRWVRCLASALVISACEAGASQAAEAAQTAAFAPVDVTAWRRPPPAVDAMRLIQDREPRQPVGAQLDLPSARAGLATELKAIGVQLDNGARIMLRRKDGRPALQYRQSF